MSPKDKPLVWVHKVVKTPPFSREPRINAGFLLRLLQRGESLSLPISRPIPSLGKRCHEPRIKDGEKNWRILYRIDSGQILILEVFLKKTITIPKKVMDICKKRLKEFDNA